MNSWLLVFILAVIQGITELQPVSSSGHLALFSALFGVDVDAGIAFAIVLHAGSLLAILAFYFKTVISLFKRSNWRIIGMLVAGSVPAGIAGVWLKLSGWDELLFGDLLACGMAFLVTASLIRLTGKAKLTVNSVTPLEKITWKQTIITGFAQMFAIMPGISRSGATITAGTLAGLEFESAAAFSFLLALPAIGGATLLEVLALIRSNFVTGGFSIAQLAAGFVTSALVSFGSLTLLVKIIKKRKLSIFSWYLFILGLLVIGWQMLKLQGRG